MEFFAQMVRLMESMIGHVVKRFMMQAQCHR